MYTTIMEEVINVSQFYVDQGRQTWLKSDFCSCYWTLYTYKATNSLTRPASVKQ